jgi:hypothetical protein
MATHLGRSVRPASMLVSLLGALGCSGESDRDSAPEENDTAAGAPTTANDDAGGRGGAGSDSATSGANPGGSDAGRSGGGSGGAEAGASGADITRGPGAGLDCASTAGSAPCAAGVLATRPCTSGPRASACVCMSPCHGPTDCGGASCVDIALASGATGSVCPPPSYTCATP